MAATHLDRARLSANVTRRILFFVVVVAVLALALVLVLLPGVKPAQADVDDYDFASWHTEIDVSVERGLLGGDVVRSEFTETITPRFPETDQNRGLVRGVPIKMGSQTMRFEDLTVTDGNGEPVPFTTSQKHGAEDVMIEIGDDSFVHGETTYVIKYALVNTMRQFEYRDGLQYAPNLVPPYRSQDIEAFSAAVRMPSELWAKVNLVPSHRDEDEGFEGLDVRCYIDGFGLSERQCSLDVVSGDGLTTISVAEENIGEDSVTLDVAFAADAIQHAGTIGAITFAQLVSAVAFIAFVLLAIGLVWHRWRRRRNPVVAADGPVITRYRSEIPPVQANLLLRDGRTPDNKATFAASILFAAVREAIAIETGDGRRQPATTVRVIGPLTDLPNETRKFLRSVLRVSREGDTRSIRSSDYGIGKRWVAFLQDVQKQARADGLIGHSLAVATRNWIFVAVLGLVVGTYVWVYFAWAHVSEDLMALPLVGGLIAVAAIIWLVVAVRGAVKATGLTPAGKERQLEILGLKQYILLAEQDRLEMLQGADTAGRTASEEQSGRHIIEVYEGLLPYAELFGLTKSWAQLLQVRYREENYSPYWIPDFQNLDFTSTLDTVRTTAAITTPPDTSSSSYSGSSDSFSGGGSAGGGFGGGSVGGR